MKKLVLLFTFILAVFFVSCSKKDDIADFKQDVISDTIAGLNKLGDMPESDEFNNSIPDGYIVGTMYEKSAEMESGMDLKSTAASLAYIGIPYQAQQTSYWCGPASASMIQSYFGRPRTQATIANYCGTTSTSGTYIGMIAKFFNMAPMTGNTSLPSWWKWAVVTLKSYDDFLSKVKSNIGTYAAPQIWNVCTYPSSTYHMPGYTSNYHHYIVGSGYDYTGAQNIVRYEDPYYKQGGGAKKTIAAYTMYKCIVGNKSMIIW